MAQAQRGVKDQFVIREMKYNSNSHRDENAYYAEGFGKPAQLSRHLTYLLGDHLNNYPLQMKFYSDILGKSRSKVVDNHEYEYPVMGRCDKAATVSETPISLLPADLGFGHSTFKLKFTDNWLKYQYIIQSENGVQARVMADPRPVGDSWEYTLQLNAVKDTASCPATEVQAGVKWVALYAPVALEESEGTESNTVTYGKVMNQLGVIRKSMSFGDKRNNDRVMDITFRKSSGQTTASWMSWFMWQFEKQWMEEVEHVYWYSRFNRDMDAGKVKLIDFKTNRPIPTAAGVLEQIANYFTYSKLTYKKLSGLIRDALFGQSDTSSMKLTLWTGTGGMEEFDRAMKEHATTILVDLGSGNVADKFVKGNGHNLEIDGFFNKFYHIDGYEIMVKHNPIFDMGKVAMGSRLHPETGLPLESYRMVFIDDSVYDGVANIQHVSMENELFQHAVVLGLTDPPKDLQVANVGSIAASQAPLRSSDINEGSYHRMKSGGMQIMRSNKCFNLECIAGL